MAFVLGAIVSPPDAVAANSIIKGLGLNKRVIAILEGESLLNDASALIAYRYAVAAVMTGRFVLWEAGTQFLLVTGGGLLIGSVLGWFLTIALAHILSATIQTSLILLAPYVAYLAAEHLHTSGILAVVSAGLLITRRAPEVFSPQTRHFSKRTRRHTTSSRTGSRISHQSPSSELRAAERTIGEYQQALLIELANEKRFSNEVLRTAERRIDLEMAQLDASK